MYDSFTFKATSSARLVHALPVSYKSYIQGYANPSFWWPRIEAFRECMRGRVNPESKRADVVVLEDVIMIIQDYLLADGRREAHRALYQR